LKSLCVLCRVTFWRRPEFVERTAAYCRSEITAEQWNAAVAVNLTAAFLCTQGAFRIMKLHSLEKKQLIKTARAGSARAPAAYQVL
jgi:NAD(P)-dependent dehydrogenase (short-subunit alcohol dehydrogenase family)